MKIILASSSPRRIEILGKLSLDFSSQAADLDEAPLAGESPAQCVMRLAHAKAQKIAGKRGEEEVLIIGSDVVVNLNGQILAKARDIDHAREMINAIQGNTVHVPCGLAVLKVSKGKTQTLLHCLDVASVDFKAMKADEVDVYLRDNIDWQDKAGAFGVQGSAKPFITAMHGSYYTVLGLPVFYLATALQLAGIAIDPTVLANIWTEDRQLAASYH